MVKCKSRSHIFSVKIKADYDYFITEGKSLENSMFSCGSNVIYRTETIKSIGGFNEKNVTEDLATSIKLHESGYHSIYYNRYFPFTTTVFIACYNEPVDVLENTIFSIKQMCKRGNDSPFILDDSTDKKTIEDIKELALKYRIGYIHRDNRRGYKAGALNDALKITDSKYFAVFDADQEPLQEFLTELIPIMEDNDDLSIIQVPQKYVNNNTPVAKGANDIQEGISYVNLFSSSICVNSCSASATLFTTSFIKYFLDLFHSLPGILIFLQSLHM